MFPTSDKRSQLNLNKSFEFNPPKDDRHSGNKIWLASQASFQVCVWGRGGWIQTAPLALVLVLDDRTETSLERVLERVLFLDQQSVKLRAAALPNPPALPSSF